MFHIINSKEDILDLVLINLTMRHIVLARSARLEMKDLCSRKNIGLNEKGGKEINGNTRMRKLYILCIYH